MIEDPKVIEDPNEKIFKYIEERAKENIRGKSFFRLTDVLEEAFILPEDKAYEILENIMSRKDIGNRPRDIVDEYINMLKKGYGSIQDQLELLGGNRVLKVSLKAESRYKKYKGENFIDVLREIYLVPEDEIIPTIEKYLKFLKSPNFSFKINKETYHKFLENDFEELDKQYDRFYS